jgi:hypothetical protein
MDEKKAAIFQAEIERISDTLFDHSVTETPIKSRAQRNTVNFLPETPGTPNCSTSDKPSYVNFPRAGTPHHAPLRLSQRARHMS